MNTRALGQLAVLPGGLLSARLVAAVCLETDHAASPCRYPAGDAWCAARDGVNLFAYRDDCGAGRAPARRPEAPDQSSSAALAGGFPWLLGGGVAPGAALGWSIWRRRSRLGAAGDGWA